MIYLDNAATTYPKPPSVLSAVHTALRRYAANPGRGGHRMAVASSRLVYDTRTKLSEFFHTSEVERVIFTSGCTASLNMVIKGVLRDGDHVVISSYEHNAVLRPLEKLKRQGRVTYTVAPVRDDDDETIDAFRKAMNSRTRMIICTHASNVSGQILPVARLCALAHANGILFCLDAAQGAGVLPIDVLRDGYDYVCCAGHKGLYGVMGSGLLLINRDLPLDTMTEGGTGSASADPIMPEYYPDRLESGTLNVPGIAGLGAGVDYVRSSGLDTLYHRELHHIRTLYRMIADNPNIRLYMPLAEYGRFAPVLSLNIEGMDSETAAALLDKRYHIAVRAGLHCAPLAHRSIGTADIGTVRFAPSAFTTDEQIRKVAQVLNKISYSS